jgi:SAM-dependent methyltransferase
MGTWTNGYPELPAASYDVVICKQVLEHLLDLETPLASIGRLVKPGGRTFVGVPIFLPPLHLGRRYLVPIFDRLCGHKGKRTHVQAFTLANFKATLLAHSKMRSVEARGFRIIPGTGGGHSIVGLARNSRPRASKFRSSSNSRFLKFTKQLQSIPKNSTGALCAIYLGQPDRRRLLNCPPMAC